MRISAIQLGYGDAESPADRVSRAASLIATQRRSDLIVLPELWQPTGFGVRHWGERAETLEGPTVQAMQEAARGMGAYLHMGSIIEASPRALERLAAVGHDVMRLPELPDEERGLWNTSILIAPDGEVIAHYRKIHRFGFGSGEPKILAPGEELVTADIEADGRTVRLGLATCYDLRFPELFRGLLDAGAEVFVVPAAWPAPRVDHWSLFARARAAEDFCAMVAVNSAGYHARTQMGGHSAIIDAAGDVLAQAGPEETILTAELDLESVDQRRSGFPALGDRRL
ncbi:nitrilase-related carbon-nitrogen hydrolase [Brevibacterium album]|uniref:nitrilase-related carbon-nitrogen hydrolase n=1 Tax=Brevibacterium album TaxID=417948 RepID=UPI000418D184|nr:nitrilase-related carbon-nitrogen hydrolase [Brevibacterium album]